MNETVCEKCNLCCCDCGYDDPSHALNEIDILTRDRDEWKRRALAAEASLEAVAGEYAVKCKHCGVRGEIWVRRP